MKTIVLGGGVIGTTTAYYLAKLGHEVQLVERQDGVAMETSFANGGCCTPAKSRALVAPRNAGQHLALAGQGGRAYLALRALPRCGAGGSRSSAIARWSGIAAAPINLRLSFYTLKCIKEIREETGVDYDLMQKGTLKIYTREAASSRAGSSARRCCTAWCSRSWTPSAA